MTRKCAVQRSISNYSTAKPQHKRSKRKHHYKRRNRHNEYSTSRKPVTRRESKDNRHKYKRRKYRDSSSDSEANERENQKGEESKIRYCLNSKYKNNSNCSDKIPKSVNTSTVALEVQDKDRSKSKIIFYDMRTRVFCSNHVKNFQIEEKKSDRPSDKDIFDPEPYSTVIPQIEIKYSKLSKRKRKKPVLFDSKRYKERSTSRYNKAKTKGKKRNNRAHHRRPDGSKRKRYNGKAKYKSNSRNSKSNDINSKSKQNIIVIQDNSNCIEDDIINDIIDPVPYSTCLTNSDRNKKENQKQLPTKSHNSCIDFEHYENPSNSSDKSCNLQSNLEKTLSTEAEIEITNDEIKSNKLKDLLEVKLDPQEFEKFQQDNGELCQSIPELSESLEASQSNESKFNNDILIQTNPVKIDNSLCEKFVASVSNSPESISNSSESISSIRSFDEEAEDENQDEASNDDKIIHFDAPKGFIINNYKVLKTLGEGTFGRVFQCQKLGSASVYALKIIRPKQKYIESAKYEAEMLKEINQECVKIRKKNKNFQSHCIELHNSFKFASPINENDTHVCLVFESCGKSLYEFIKENNYRGFYIDQILAIAKQMFEGLDFIHRIGIIHTDIKPENILFQRDISRKVVKLKDFPQQIFTKIKLYKQMLKNEINEEILASPYMASEEIKVKLIDFGGAIKCNEHHGRTINTRQYRSPEVILGCCEWNEKSDIWSLGCVLFELYTGEMLFPTHDDFEHLAMIEKVRGPLELWMTENAGAVTDGEENDYWDGVFTEDIILSGVNSWEGRTRWDCISKQLNETCYIETIPLLEEAVMDDHKIFLDLLKYTLTIDPDRRPSAKQVLEKFFR